MRHCNNNRIRLLAVEKMLRTKKYTIPEIIAELNKEFAIESKEDTIRDDIDAIAVIYEVRRRNRNRGACKSGNRSEWWIKGEYTKSSDAGTDEPLFHISV